MRCWADPTARRTRLRQEKGGVLPLNSKLVPSIAKGGAPAGVVAAGAHAGGHGQDIRDASAQQNTQTGGWETDFVLSQDAAKSFERFTAAHDNDRGRLAIVLDKTRAERADDPEQDHRQRRDRRAVRPGGSRRSGAESRAGSLPASVEFLEQRAVGASLGNDSIAKG